MTNLITLSSKQLNRAAALKERITALEAQLASILGAPVFAEASPEAAAAGRKSKMSAAGRARIAAAQRVRWAKVRGAKSAGTTAKPAAKKRVVSAAVKARLSAMAKKRWAKAKKSGRSAL